MADLESINAVWMDNVVNPNINAPTYLRVIERLNKEIEDLSSLGSKSDLSRDDLESILLDISSITGAIKELNRQYKEGNPPQHRDDAVHLDCSS